MSRASSRVAPVRRLALALVGLVALVASCLPAGRALAQDPQGIVPSDISAEATPALSSNGAFFEGWNELIVRLQNAGTKPARGQIAVISHSPMGDRHSFEATAPYTVGAGASVSVHLPMQVLSYAEVLVEVKDELGQKLAIRKFTPSTQSAVQLVDVHEPSHLRGAIHETSISPQFSPSSSRSGPSGSGSYPQLILSSPRVDPSTGDPMLPKRAAGYSTAAAVLMGTDVLSRLTGQELEAIAGYVLGGGTLALVVTRPEDLRHPTLAALVGGEVTAASVYAATLKELILPTLGSSSGKLLPRAKNPSDAVSPMLSGYSGGNLHGSPFGNSAYYGLGEVHLLAFDPTKRPAVEDPWALARVSELTRRAYDRRASIIYRQGAPASSAYDMGPVRKQLDPNENSRWAIGAAAILLCIYSVLAGPVNFSIASRRGKPLHALRWLLVISAATFLAVVGIGVAAKGVFGRARHITLVEAGAGMTLGTARRWRGFYASRARELTVRTTDTGSVVSSAVFAGDDDGKDHLVVDRDGARLVEVAALPWQTVVIREDGFAPLGDGISIVLTEANDVTVTNRSGRDIRAAILRLPGGDSKYFARIADGEKVAASAARTLGANVRERSWIIAANAVRRAGRLELHPLGGQMLKPILEDDAPGLADAWEAVERTAGSDVNWFPEDVPILFAQLDGGEGRVTDAGLRLESDRLLVRVVGYGGKQ